MRQVEVILTAVDEYAAELNDPENDWRNRAQAKTFLREKRWQAVAAPSRSGESSGRTARLHRFEPQFRTGIPLADRDRCQKALKALCRQEGEAKVQAWIGKCLIELSDAVLVLHASTRFARNYLETNFRIPLERAWAGPVEIVLTTNNVGPKASS